MADVNVHYVKRMGAPPHEWIVGLGGADGGGWFLHLEQVVGDLRRGLNTFYVHGSQIRVPVTVGKDQRGEPTLLARLPGSRQNLLEMLAEVPDELLSRSEGWRAPGQSR